MKETSQTSAPTNPKVTTKPATKKPVVVEEEVNEEFGDEDAEETEQTQAPVKEEKVDIGEEIRDLQDNGIYRLQKLSVLHQINNNLKIIAGVLADLSK
jgi:hypothetical protein